jgi:large repetitive protein
VAVLVLAGASPAAAQPACGDVITSNTKLTADLDCRFQQEGGLTVGGPGVTIDLGGHQILTFGTAIDNPGYANVTIRHGSIAADTVGILLKGASGNTIRDVHLEGIVDGIVLQDSDSNRIVSDTLRSVGIYVDAASDGNVLRGNLVTAHEGVVAVRGSYNQVVDNIIWTGDDLALALLGGSHNVVLRNRVIGSFSPPMRIFGSDDNLVARNTFVELGDQRVADLQVLADSDRNVIRDNELSGGPVGIQVRGGSDNALVRNTLGGAGTGAFGVGDGIDVDATTTATVVRGNLVHDFGDDGIDAEVAGTVVARNSANDNGDYGIVAVPGVIDGGGNTATGNGNPAQCAGVSCN